MLIKSGGIALVASPIPTTYAGSRFAVPGWLAAPRVRLKAGARKGTTAADNEEEERHGG